MVVKIRTVVHETEDLDKIKRSLEDAFGIEFKIVNSELVADCNDLSCLAKMREQIKVRGIEPTVKEVIKNLSKGINETFIKLNKQAICKGFFNFIEEDLPLGVVEIIISMPKEKVFEYLELNP